MVEYTNVFNHSNNSHNTTHVYTSDECANNEVLLFVYSLNSFEKAGKCESVVYS